MSTQSTSAPFSASIKGPRRSKDIFEFLHNENAPESIEDTVTVMECEANGLVAVTVKSPDGRVLSRKVPANSWSQSGYRLSLIRSMSLLLD